MPDSVIPAAPSAPPGSIPVWDPVKRSWSIRKLHELFTPIPPRPHGLPDTHEPVWDEVAQEWKIVEKPPEPEPESPLDGEFSLSDI